MFGSCSTDVVVRRVHVKFGVGLTIGSVTPGPAVSCIQGVIFEDCYSEDPLKVRLEEFSLCVYTDVSSISNSRITIHIGHLHQDESW